MRPSSALARKRASSRVGPCLGCSGCTTAGARDDWNAIGQPVDQSITTGVKLLVVSSAAPRYGPRLSSIAG